MINPSSFSSLCYLCDTFSSKLVSVAVASLHDCYVLLTGTLPHKMVVFSNFLLKANRPTYIQSSIHNGSVAKVGLERLNTWAKTADLSDLKSNLQRGRPGTQITVRFQLAFILHSTPVEV